MDVLSRAGFTTLPTESSGSDSDTSGEEERAAPRPDKRGNSAIVALVVFSISLLLLFGLVEQLGRSNVLETEANNEAYILNDEAIRGGNFWHPKNPVAEFPIVYVVLGPHGRAFARAIVQMDGECPSIWLEDVKIQPEVRIRAKGSAGMPYDFPILVCEAILPRTTVGGTFGSRKLPAVTKNPSTYVLMGDTGLRVKPRNDGTCKEYDDRKLYGIKQCKEHQPFNRTNVKGDFQSPANWPLYELMESAARVRPDVVIHLGDFLYRQAPCPQGAACQRMKMGSFWGDNFRGWLSDFFHPAKPLLEVAPWVVIRGNHENCERGGHGWFLLLDPRPLPTNWNLSYCLDYSDPYSIPFQHEQLLIMDDSAISPMHGGVDHFDFSEMCSVAYTRAQLANRFSDAAQSRARIQYDVDYFTRQMDVIGDFASKFNTNFYVSHRPLFGVACNASHYQTLDWTMQQAFQAAATKLNNVVVAIGGHMHWFEGLVFQNRTLPMQLVVGNAGTKLIPNSVPSKQFESSLLEVLGKRVDSAFAKSTFGYTVVETDPTGPFNISVREVIGGTKTREIWTTGLPRGPRLP